MTHGSLFTGIGGFDLAADWSGIETLFTVEIDDFCNKIIDKHYPNVRRYRDIREFDGTEWFGKIDIISGGVPCQPASIAGKRKGEADDRWLWPEAIRVVGEVRPAFIFFENPPGILSLDNGEPFERILSALENEGYYNFTRNNGKKEIVPVIIPACGVGVWHKRDRVWIIAYTMHNGNGQQGKSNRQCKNEFESKKQEGRTQYTEQFDKLDKLTGSKSQNVPDTSSQGLQESTQGKFRSFQQKKKIFKGCTIDGKITKGWDYWAAEPELGRVAHGIPNRVDRIKSLGNAIVPQLAYIFFEAIKQVEETSTKT